MIEKETLTTYDLTLDEVNTWFKYLKVNIGLFDEELSNSLWNKGYLIKEVDGYSCNYYFIDIINTIMAEIILPQEVLDRVEELAAKLVEIYPQRKLPSTNNNIRLTRSSKRETRDALVRFFKWYEEYPTNEEIIEATKKYVANNQYSNFFRILKYFIIKDERKNGGCIVSDLSTYLEAGDIIEPTIIDTSNSWVNEL